ncbi:MAG: hypothetical protein AAF804_11350 [Bacteroidota bacterium]
MDGIQLITDGTGNLSEIRVDVRNNPNFASEVYRLIRALRRAQASEKSQRYRELSHKWRRQNHPLSQQDLLALIQEAKSSGEITEEEFYQAHPQWRLRARLS